MAVLTRSLLLLFFALGPAFAGSGGGEAGRYLETDDYLHGAFAGAVPETRTLWVTGELRDAVERALGHPLNALRVRYWQDGNRTAWVLDEIGKDLPITIGVTVAAGAIDGVHILEFRESRGWEVRYPFFTEQFAQARLDGNERLDRQIDGITGATLSVRAVTRIARVALLLHEHVAAVG